MHVKLLDAHGILFLPDLNLFHTVAYSPEPVYVQWPTALSRILRSGPDVLSTLCAVFIMQSQFCALAYSVE
jgi:hypothetical protein